MPSNGSYLFTSVGFSEIEEPILLFQDNDIFTEMHPIGESFTLTFDTSQRHCTGWRDITSGERFSCPDHQQIDSKYEQCAACQQRTGFNPAFYHAKSVSPQQEARNSEPHILYLAHFGEGIIKVGISHAKRGRARLLEQGARTAIILDELSSAHIARHYEAKIAALSGFLETVQLRKKADLLSRPYDRDVAIRELLAAKASIETTISITFNKSDIASLDSIYFPSQIPNLINAHDTTDKQLISGTCIGQIGSLLFAQQADSVYYLPLKKYIGYTVTLSDTVTPIDTPAQQISLF